ncbi:transforming growth factor-beta receptor type 3-like protein isoform X2 [Columba livia]
MAPRGSRPLPLLLLLLLPGGGPAGPPPGWPWGDSGDTGGPLSTQRPRCSGNRPGPRCPPRPPRLRLDVSAAPEFPPAPGPRAVPAGGRVFVQISLSRAPPGLSFSLRRCLVSPRSSPPPPGPPPPPPPRPLVVLRGGCGAGGGAGGARRLLRSFLLPPRFPEPLQFLHCHLRLCRAGGGHGGHGLPRCRAESCDPREGGASGSGSAPRPRSGPAHGRALRTVTRPIVVTLGPAGTAAPGAPPLLFPPLPPVLHRPPPPPPPPRAPPRSAPAGPAVPPPAVAAVSFGAFVVGAALAGGLWWVHGRTAARRPPPISSVAPQL